MLQPQLVDIQKESKHSDRRHLTLRLDRDTIAGVRELAEYFDIRFSTMLRHCVEYAVKNKNFKVLMEELYKEE